MTPNVSGSSHVAPSVSTSYNGSGIGHNGNAFSCPATLTVSAPTSPSATITSSLGSTVNIGKSSTITATFAAGSGDTLLEDNIDGAATNATGWTGGLGADTNPTSPKSITFTPSSAGTYTFLARMRTAYYPWATYAQTSVTVPPPPTCSMTLDPSTLTLALARYSQLAAVAPPPPPPSGSTLTWESTGADTASITGIGPVEISGSTTVSPSQTTTYTGTFTGSTGTAICSATLTVQCNVGTAYSCSDQTIVRTDTDASCQTTVVNGATCTPPSFCSTGSSICLYPEVGFPASGHLKVQPSIVTSGDSTFVRWNVSNVSSCTVSGTNGDHWTVAGNAGNDWTSSSGHPGMTSRPITGQTVYTLSCTGLDGSTVNETATVDIVPVFEER